MKNALIIFIFVAGCAQSARPIIAPGDDRSGTSDLSENESEPSPTVQPPFVLPSNDPGNLSNPTSPTNPTNPTTPTDPSNPTNPTNPAPSNPPSQGQLYRVEFYSDGGTFTGSNVVGENGTNIVCNFAISNPCSNQYPAGSSVSFKMTSNTLQAGGRTYTYANQYVCNGQTFNSTSLTITIPNLDKAYRCAWIYR